MAGLTPFAMNCRINALIGIWAGDRDKSEAMPTNNAIRMQHHFSSPYVTS